jgi:hypothetical protein
MNEAFEMEVIMAIVTAFFSRVWEQTVAAQPRMMELTP